MDNNNSLYNNERDAFDKLANSKLANHRLPVDSDCWTEIEKQIKPQGRRAILWYIGSAAAVIAVLLLFFISPRKNTDSYNAVAELTTTDSLNQNYNKENGVEKEETPIFPQRLIASARKKNITAVASHKDSISTTDSISSNIPQQSTVTADAKTNKNPDFTAESDSIKKRQGQEKGNKLFEPNNDFPFPEDTEYLIPCTVVF